MPKKITSKQQYYAAMAEIESYLQKGFSNLTTKEEDHLEELSKAVETWELKEYPMPMQPSFPDILIYVMQFKRYTQTELSEDLSISKSLLSEILNGKKQPNLNIIVSLHKKFGIDANILLESVSQLPPFNPSPGSSSGMSTNARRDPAPSPAAARKNDPA